ncbi:MAG: hypothetical protein M1829_001536 [Trizodia sp. TS-e1964]|nr:MAG: hypothetical protein M1829_001536 [Trizodia sp. TS-e1964]
MSEAYAPQSPDLSAEDTILPDAHSTTAHFSQLGQAAFSSPQNTSSHEIPMNDAEPVYVAPKRGRPKTKGKIVTSAAPSPSKEEPANSTRERAARSDRVEVKTKFPVARIKRIMQADEDVGKVAQVTPVIVSKALEMFMITLTEKATEEAKHHSSKRITMSHLKQAIAKDEQFDFLQEIMGKVPDAPTPKGGKAEENSDGDGKKKKRAAGSGRRKRKNPDE